MDNAITKEGTKVSWVHQAGDKYVCCGKDRNGKRFRIESDNWHYINGINCWQGRKYLVRDGKRHLIQSTVN